MTSKFARGERIPTEEKRVIVDWIKKFRSIHVREPRSTEVSLYFTISRASAARYIVDARIEILEGGRNG